MRPFDSLEKLVWLAEVVGEADAVEILRANFSRIRGSLSSRDVAFLYDDKYRSMIQAHETAAIIGDVVQVNKYQFPVFQYLIKNSIVADTTVLDLGCGTGNFAVGLATRGMRVTGIDSSAMMVDAALNLARTAAPLCRHVPEFVLGELRDVRSESRYHFITLNDVVEHLSKAEVMATLAECRSRLETGGEVIVHTPNGRAAGWDIAEKTIRARLIRHFVRKVLRRGYVPSLVEAYYYQAHVNVMGYGTLARLAREVGLSRSRVEYDTPSPIGIWQDVFCPDMMVVFKP
ncbi:MAG: class I SAM-dependent methyltransferase [Deferrisomatales bacterium]